MSFIVNVNGKPQVFVHTSNLGTIGRMYGMGVEAPSIDVTAFGDSARRNILGQETVSIRYDGLFDSASAYQQIKDFFQNKRLISIWPDGAYASAKGAALTTAIAQQFRPAGQMGEVLSIGFEVISDAQFDNAISYQGLVTTSTLFTSTTQDIATNNTSGGAFFIHILSASASGGGSPQWVCRFQDSDSDVAGNFTLVADGTSGITVFNISNGGATSIVQTTTATLRRYHRFRASLDATTGSIIFMAGFGKR